MNMKRGDTKPDLVINCTSDGAAVDFTTATTVQVVCRRDGTATPLFTRTATGAADGSVTYEWQAGDTDTVGRLLFEVIATWPLGTQRFPASSYLPVDVEENLS